MTPGTPTYSDRDSIAAEWVLRLQAPALSDEAVAEWLAWCDADALNRRAFERMEEAWVIAGKAGRRQSSGKRRVARRTLAIAASVTVVVMLGISTLFLVKPHTPNSSPNVVAPGAVQVGPEARLETERGRIVTAHLEDGSQVDMGGLSALTVRYTNQSRLIIADEGEAYFDVQKDRARPFIVQAGAITATAVGTAFAVTREENSVSIAVAKGIVEVRAAPAQPAAEAHEQAAVLRVVSGQRILFERGKLVREALAVEAATIASWREGRLEFRNEPLRRAVARLSRYTDREITVSDAAIDDLRVTGTAYVDRIDAWLDGIQVVLPVHVEKVDERRVFIKSAR